MTERFIIRVETTDKDGVIETSFLTAKDKTYTTHSLHDATEALKSAKPWFKGAVLTVCVLTPLTSLDET